MNRCLPNRLQQVAAAGLLAVAITAPVASRASPQLATSMGCYNCHGDFPRGKAPSFEQLAARYAARRGDAAAERRLVAKFQAGEPLERVAAHERLSPETAKALIHWLVEGAG